MDKKNLTSFDKVFPMLVQKYETFLPPTDETIEDKMNSLITYLNRVGKLNNDVVKQWNNVAAWTMEDGLKVAVEDKVNILLENGDLNPIFEDVLNESVLVDINENIETLTTSLNEKANKIESMDTTISKKADKTYADNIQGQVNNLVLGAVGDGNNPEIIQARGVYGLLNQRFDIIENVTNDYLKDLDTLLNLTPIVGWYPTNGVYQNLSSYHYVSINVIKGEKYKFSGASSNGTVPYALSWDIDNKFIGVIGLWSEITSPAVDKVITIQNTGKLVIQGASTSALTVKKTTKQSTLTTKLGDVETSVSSVKQAIYFSEYSEITTFIKSLQNYYFSGAPIGGDFTDETTKHASLSGNIYKILNCSVGQSYKFYSNVTSTTYPIVIFLDASNKCISAFYATTDQLGTMDRTFVIPSGCVKMIVQSRNANYNLYLSNSKTFNKDYVEQKLTANNTQILTQVNTTIAFDELEEADRMYALERRIGFTWKPFDTGKLVFMFDDANSDISTIADVFKSYNFPVSIAMITNRFNDITDSGETTKTVLNRIVANGGEIFSHSISTATLDTMSDIDATNALRNSKQALRDNGFNVNGFISPNGIYKASIKQEYPKYYRYGYYAGDKAPFTLARTNMTNIPIDQVKSLIDTCISSKSLLILMAHRANGSENGFTKANLETILSYVAGKTGVVVTNVKDVFNQYGGI